MNFKIACLFRVYPNFLSTSLAFNIFCECWILHSFIFIIRARNSNVPSRSISIAPYLVSFSLLKKQKNKSLLPYSVHIILSIHSVKLYLRCRMSSLHLCWNYPTLTAILEDWYYRVAQFFVGTSFNRSNFFFYLVLIIISFQINNDSTSS